MPAMLQSTCDRLEAAQKRTHPLFDVQVVDLVVHGAGGVAVGQGATPNATA
jgi:hypothetical protein